MDFSSIFESTARTANMVGTGMQAGGSLFSAFNKFAYADSAEQAGKMTALQMRQQASDVQAASQRTAWSVERQGELMASRALAVAAASGGGASDPTVVNLIAKNAGEFAYRKAVALYEGESKAQGLRYGADVKEYEGKAVAASARAAGIASMFKAGTSIMSGYATDDSLFKRFGGGGPDMKELD